MNYDIQISALIKIMNFTTQQPFVGKWKTEMIHQQCPVALVRCDGCDGTGDESNNWDEFDACRMCDGEGKRNSDYNNGYGWRYWPS